MNKSAEALQTPRTPRSLQTVLVTLVMVTLVPALGTALFAVWQAGSSYRQASMARLDDTTRALARAIEDDLGSKAVVLQAVAAGMSAQETSLQDAQRWLDRLLDKRGRLAYVESSGVGDPSVRLPDAAILSQFHSSANVAGHEGVSLSNLLSTADQTGPKIALSTLVRLPGDSAPGVLSLLLQPDQLLRIEPQQGSTDTSLLIAVTDGTGRIVARSRDSQRFVGRPVPDWHKLKALQVPAGQFEALTTEGHGIIFSFRVLANTPGWVVVVGEPLVSFNTRWQRPLQYLAIGGGVGTLAALFLAWRMARRIIRPVRALERNARAVAGGMVVAPVINAHAFPIAEFESMRQSIESAQQTLHSRAQAEREHALILADGERRYRTLAETGAVVLWRSSSDGKLVAAVGWELLTGEPEREALDSGWAEFVHPDDRSVTDSMLAEVAAGSLRIDAEFRVRGVNGQWRWMRGRGAAVRAGEAPVTEWVGVLEDVDERRRAHARIAHMAHHDALTGLPNRVEFRDQLETALQRAGRGEKGAVLYIDLDHFKTINDTLGHPVGDALLRAVAQRLTALVRECDTVARLAGDEFAIVQSQVSGPGDAADLAERVVRMLSEPYDLGGQRVEIGASIGIMLIENATEDVDQLLKFADLALYRAKQDGRGRHHFFDPQMDVLMQERRRNELELRAAFERDQFELLYRPLINVAFRGINGVAATLCWQHPLRGVLAPQDFWSSAAELGLDRRLMAWALVRLCADLVQWPDLIKGAVDISAVLPKDASALVGWIEAALGQSGLSPERLELEVDERALAGGAHAVMSSLHRLKAMGVRIAVVRLGSDASVLGLLRHFPFDMVKLGSALVRDLGLHKDGDAIARAVAKLCDDLGIMTAAEGVDTEDQFKLLSAEYCCEVQGAMFGAAGTMADVLQASGLPLARPIPQ